jgi:hypothetical protein
MNERVLRQRANDLRSEVGTKNAEVQAGRISKAEYKAYIDRASKEVEEIESDLKTLNQARRFSSAAEPASLGLPQLSAPADGGRICAPSPMDMTPQQVSGLIQAAQARTPYSVEIAPKSYRDSVITKAAVTEAGIGGSSLTGQLPPVQSLYAVGLGYEPTRPRR